MTVLAIMRDYNYPPISLAYLAPVFREANIEYEFELCADTQLLKKHENRTDISCICISAMVRDFAFVLESVKRMKSYFPDTPIILGGRISVTPLRILEKLGVDYLVYGDARPTMSELIFSLADSKSQVEDIPGIAIFNKGFPAQATAKKKSKPLNDFAPYWGDFDIEHYSKLRTMGHPTGYPIITGMGCVGNCTFCSSGMGGVRFRPVEEVIEEMKQVDKKYDIDMFFFATEIFFSKKSDVEKFCTMYKATGLNIPWHCQLRADFNNELIPLLADAGCRGVSIGVEAYDNAALKAMNKGITTKLIDATIGTAKKHGMDVLIGMMIGNIGDTRESVVKTVDFLIEAGCISFGLQTLLIYPGTKSYDLAIKNGLVEDEFAHCLKNSAPDVWDQILYDEYPNVSAIPKDEYRALYREQMIRINGYLLEKKAAKNIDFLNNNYTCRNCGKLDEYPMETNSMPTTRICDACAHYNYLNPVVQLMRNDRELLSSLQDLNDQGPSRVAVFCPQKQLTCSALQLFFHPYGNLTPVFMRDQIPENALEMEMTFDTMASFNGDRFSSALSFCVNCPHEMEQLAIERGIDAQNCLRATPEDLCTDFALNFEKRLFWYSVNHDIMCFGEKAAEFLTAKGLNRAAIVTDEGVAHAFASGWEKKGAVTSFHSANPLESTSPNDSKPVLNHTEVVRIQPDVVIIATPSVDAQMAYKKEYQEFLPLGAPIYTLNDLFREFHNNELDSTAK